jgi:threonine/homoserine/homoserine lactone efflux protein
MSLFVNGLIVGISIAAPVGPIGVLCIRRTLAHGRLAGFISGLGAATADACYGSIAAFGLTFLSAVLVERQDLLRLLGGAFLCYLGIRAWLERPKAAPTLDNAVATSFSGSDSRSLRLLSGDFFSTYLLTLTNPLTILSFAAIFAGLGSVAAGNTPLAAFSIVLGVFSGSALWWLFLSFAANALRARFLKPSALIWINRLSGAIIFSYGVVAIVSVVWHA